MQQRWIGPNNDQVCMLFTVREDFYFYDYTKESPVFKTN